MINYKIIILKNKLLKSLIKVLSLIGIISGMSSCNNNNYSPMYGTPSPAYQDIKFHGTVKTQDSLKPIKAVRVTIVSKSYNDSAMANTDATGNFSVYKSSEENEEFIVKFKVTDTIQSHGKFYPKNVNAFVGCRDYSNRDKIVDAQLQKKP